MPCAVGWHEGFGANRLKIARHILDTTRAAPAIAVGLDGLGAAFEALALEYRTDLVTFELSMLVIGIASAECQLFKKATAGFHFAAKVGAILAQTDCNSIFAAFGHRNLFASAHDFFVMMSDARTTRNAVFGVIDAERNAQIAAFVDKGSADPSSPGFYRAVGNAAAIVRGFAQLRGFVEMTFAFLFICQIEDFSA